MVDEGKKRPHRALPSGNQNADGAFDEHVQSDLDSEALTHLLISCEGLSAHVGAWLEKSENSVLKLIVDDLSRMRNTLVILDRPAGQFVLAEILNLLDQHCLDRTVSSDNLKSVLTGLASELSSYIDSLQQFTSIDSALAMVPLINDCRACRDEMLISDALMLAAGIEAQGVSSVSAGVQNWDEERRQWIDLVNEHYAYTSDLLSQWQIDVRCSNTITQLIDRLEELVTLSARFGSLCPLEPLFQSAVVVLFAINEGQLRFGPALRNLFVQLTQTIEAIGLIETPEDLVPFDLLRNFLYYAAQIDMDTPAATSIRRRYRLERVRRSVNSLHDPDTLTINAGYHLSCSIRATIARESAQLKAWLENSTQLEPGEIHSNPPGTVRLRVRAQQLQAVLTLLGATEAATCLLALARSLQAVGDLQSVKKSAHIEMINSLASFDTLIYRVARQHVIRGSDKLRRNEAGSVIYTDMAVDACLREARNELLEFSHQLIPRLQPLDLNELVMDQLTRQLSSLNYALRILPLPGFSELLVSVKDMVLPKLNLCVSVASSENPDDSAVSRKIEGPVVESLTRLLDLLDEYLSYAMLPHADVNWLLSDAETALDILIQQLSVDYSDTLDSSIAVLTTEIENDALMLLDDHSLTLDVEDYIQLDELDDEHSVTLDITVDSMYRYSGCSECLDRLEACVKSALTPRAGTDAWLPNDKMLRALHDLTINAQGTEIVSLLTALQPLQRTALVLHRNGRHFNAHETRFIGELANAFRLRMEAAQTGTKPAGQVLDIEARLGGVLQSALSGTRDVVSVMPQALSASAQTHSLDHVFYQEASELLEQLQELLRSGSSDAETVNAALTVLHTLKGNARMTGRLAMSECLHTLEADIQSMSDAGEQIGAIEQSHDVLLEFLDKPSTKWQANNSSLKDLSASVTPAAGGPAEISDTEESNRAITLAQELNIGQTQLGKELTRLQTIAREIRADILQWRDTHISIGAKAHSQPDEDEFFDNLTSMNNKLLSAIKKADSDNQRNTKASVGLQKGLISSRLIRIDTIGTRLIEIVKDAAKHSERKATLRISGGDLMIDRVLSKQLVHVLDHLTRNAVVHGIEIPEERLAKGKTHVGVISLQAATDGNGLYVSLTDDGRGIDIESINEKSGVHGEPGIDDSTGLLRLLCTRGFSSVKNADTLAGHGLGLSAVQTTMKQLGGSIELVNREQEGLSVKLHLSPALVVCCAVMVRDGTQLYGFPASHVKSVAITEINGKSKSEAVGSEHRTLLMQDLLGYDPVNRSHDSTASSEKPRLRVVHEGKVFNVVVDAVLGYRELLMRPLSQQMSSLQRFSAVGINVSGEQALILDLPLILSAGLHVTEKNENKTSPDFSS